jgi:hypothetical protein
MGRQEQNNLEVHGEARHSAEEAESDYSSWNGFQGEAEQSKTERMPRNVSISEDG